MKIKIFTKNELDFIEKVAAGRAEGKTYLKSSKLMCSGRDDGSDYDKNLEGAFMGVAGEYAVAEQVKGFADFIQRPDGDKHQADIICRDSKGALSRISVKTTKYSPPILKLNSKREIKDATHIANCRYFNDERGRGVEMYWIKSKEEFLNKMKIKNFGYGDRLCLG